LSQTATKTRPDFSAEPSFRGLGSPELRDDPASAPVLSPPVLPAQVLDRLRLLWDQRRIIARVTLVSLGMATAIAFLLPKQYRSTVQLMPPEPPSSSANMLAALSAKAGNGIGAMAGGLLGGNSTGALFVGVLRSRTLEDRLVERFDLRKVYGERLEEDACAKLAGNSGASEDRKTGIISITVLDRNPGRAAALAAAHVEELNRLIAELSTSAAHRERVFLEERLKAVKQELDAVSNEFSQFASKNAAINIPEQGKAMVEAAALLQGQLIAAESELKGLSEIYTANNVRVRSVQARVSELRRQLEKLDGDSPAAKIGSSSAGSSTESLDPVRGDYPTIRELPLLGVTYADLLRRTKIQEAVYETLTQQYELAKVQEAKETPSVKVLDPASIPEKKSYPPRLAILFLGGCFGLAGGAIWVLARAGWEQISADDPGKALASEVFHTISRSMNAKMPWAPPNGSRWQAVTHRAWMRWVKSKPPM
jgi:capsule polysaccharide export protein KpsE/RkpR